MRSFQKEGFPPECRIEPRLLISGHKTAGRRKPAPVTAVVKEAESRAEEGS
jgi:hypothetical protein